MQCNEKVDSQQQAKYNEQQCLRDYKQGDHVMAFPIEMYSWLAIIVITGHKQNSPWPHAACICMCVHVFKWQKAALTIQSHTCTQARGYNSVCATWLVSMNLQDTVYRHCCAWIHFQENVTVYTMALYVPDSIQDRITAKNVKDSILLCGSPFAFTGVVCELS